MVSATRADASAVPVIAADCSPALMMSSPATFEITGASGARVSMEMVRVAAGEVLPAASVAVAERVSAPWPMAVRSAAFSAYVHTPWASAVTVRTVPPSVSATLAPASAVPLMVEVCSLALTTLSVATASIDGARGTPVSSANVRTPLPAPTLPAASVTRAVRVFCPSVPRSAASTVMSTWPAATSPAPSVTRLGVANAAPSSSSSTWSPATAFDPVCGRDTRKTVLTASALFMEPLERSALPCSASVAAAGATVSSTKESAALDAPRLPATSTIAADRLLEPSAPSAAAVTVKFTTPACRSASLSTTSDSTELPSRSSSRSPACAREPAVGSVTWKVVVSASAWFMNPSTRSSLPDSVRTGAAGATVSTMIVRVAGADTLPAASAAVAVTTCEPWPIAVRSLAVSV